MTRRHFIALTAGTLGTLLHAAPAPAKPFAATAESPFRLSLAQWSLNRTLFAGLLDNLDFPRVARREFNIDRVEFVDSFFVDKARDAAYLADLKKRGEDEGVSLGLIMIDRNGPLGSPDKSEREKAVENTRAWIDAAAFLGCDTIRVNARGADDSEELRRWIAESCATLADYAAPRNINVTIENHGGPSSDPEWLVSVMKAVDKPNFGTLPDFGNFPEDVDRYDAVEMFMPYAKAVSAKAGDFTPDGLVAETDFFRMMRIVRDGGYAGYVGIESVAPDPEGEARAIRLTRDLLLRIFEEQKRRVPIFNGQDLDGWVPVAGGEWTVRDGVLVGTHGRDWSTDPEKTGSWLRAAEQYGDFRLELQFRINEGGNSGIFFRSARDRNPAFTGYEMQIHGSPDQPPSPQGPGALYDLVAPVENVIRTGDRWNTVTITAQGPRIAIEMNGKTIIQTEQTRSMKGYIGLQNHDDQSVVQFRNIRIEELTPSA